MMKRTIVNTGNTNKNDRLLYINCGNCGKRLNSLTLFNFDE